MPRLSRRPGGSCASPCSSGPRIADYELKPDIDPHYPLGLQTVEELELVRKL